MTKTNVLRLLISAFLAFAFAGNVFAQGAGDKAPEIKISKWMNSTPEFKNNFKGKTVFLEFWATWCGPCKKMIPEINKLVSKFSSDKVVFVSITQEEADKVKPFMEKNEMKACVALDDKGQTNKNYGIKFIPQLFIINPDGIIDYAGHPAEISEEAIIEYLKTGKIAAAPKEEDPEKNLLYALTISKTMYAKEKPQYQFKKGGVQFINLNLNSILQMAFEATPMTLIMDNGIINDNLDIYYQSGTNTDFELFKDKFTSELLNSLSLKYRKTTEKNKVIKISCRDCSKIEGDYQQLLKTTKKIESDVKEANGKIIAKSVPIQMIVRSLETNFKQIFIDNTNLKGFYDLTIDTKNFKTAISDLENAGFKVEESEENVSIIKVFK
jgi:cytochrome c biogenesis protein CcmG, thiol:disulfide interchange protein DsbE